MGSGEHLSTSSDAVSPKADTSLEPASLEAPVQNNARTRGGWKTLPFILGNEVCERMGSLSILWNLVPYLFQRYHMTILRSSYIVNAISGTCSLTPLLGAYLADSYFGRYNTILGSSFFAFGGLVLLCASAWVKNLQPKRCIPPLPYLYYTCEQANLSQFSFLMGAFGFIAIGSGGLRSCVYSFGADQFDVSTPQGKRARQSFFNWFYLFSCISLLIGTTIIVYIQNSISWGLGYFILAIAMVVSVILFVIGSRFYIHHPITSSPYTSVFYVLTAAISKHNLPLPSDPIALCSSKGDDNKDQGPRLQHTNQLRWLDKAAIVEASNDLESKDVAKGPWRLCTLQQVEECKSFLNLLPIWGCGILTQVAQNQLGIFTVGQAIYSNPHLGHLKVAPASLIVVGLATFVVAIPIYDRIIVPLARRYTKNPRGLSLLQRIGIGILGFVLTMVVAGLVEKKRLNELQLHGELMNVTWLIPQLALLGLSDTFAAIGQFEFYYEQLPMGMKSMAGALYWSSSALGAYVANLLTYIVQKATKRGNWLPLDINEGHLDYYYYLLAGFVGLTLILFLVCAHRYKPVEYLEDEPSSVM